MAMKRLNENEPYEGHYQFIGATKYRLNLFMEEEMRTRLKEIIQEIINKLEDTESVESTVAYNHIHVLIHTKLEPSNVAQRLFGISSRLMRKEYPELVEKAKKGLWGGKSCEAIVDENHLKNCISYIKRHNPDNTKC